MTATQARTCLITGGTGGIGRAIAERLGRSGHRIYLCARTSTAVESTVRELRDLSVDAEGQRADVRSADDITALVGRAVDCYGPVEVLVNNAGRGGGGRTAEISDALWSDVIETNVTSVFRLTREVLTSGGMSGWGRIINIASVGGKQGMAFGVPHCASKHAVVGFSKALGLELAKSAITVNAVCPAHVETPMIRAMREGYAQSWGVSTETVLQRFTEKIPLGRYTTGDEVASVVSYLASDDAAPITAQAINICGGVGWY